MAEHKLQAGRTLIHGLVALGRGLGYHVDPEHAVRKAGRKPPAVDVAWMGDDLQQFPLMIFEVESTASNTMANNAVKVFGQSNEQFEKPLFFFQIVVRAGEDTSRIDMLRGQFGLNNYRLYRLDRDEKIKLLIDILSQHRRLKREFDLIAFSELLEHEAWRGINTSVVFDHLEKLEYNVDFLDSYARLSRRDTIFRARFVSRLLQEEQRLPRILSRSNYQTYIGYHWYRPIHLALLARAYPERALEFFERLRHWQEKSSFTTQIGPHFGLSREYDDFLVAVAPGFLAAVAAIFGNLESVNTYLAQQINAILDKIGRAPTRFSFYVAAWLLNLSAGLDDSSLFQTARNFVNERGGIACECLAAPPFMISFEEDREEDQWDKRLMLPKAPVPDKAAFCRIIRDSTAPVPTNDTAVSLGIDLLIEQEETENFGQRTLALLAGDSSRARA